MRLFFVILLLLPELLNAQLIYTFAGGGTSGLGDGGSATTATIDDPNGITFDKYGNFYLSDNLGNRVRKVNSSGIISTVAGNGSGGYYGDFGLADTSCLWQPVDVACDTFGNLYIVDEHNNRIRKVDVLTGIISTIAGTGFSGYSGDNGDATAAMLSSPDGICMDRVGNIYISDMANFRIRKISTDGTIITVVGNGTCCTGGDGGPATSAQLWLPVGLTMDDTGNLFIADYGSKKVRKVDTAGIISTFAGTGSYIYNGDSIAALDANIDPMRIAIGNYNYLYIVDNYNNRVRVVDTLNNIYTVAGNGIDGFSGDDCQADTTELGDPGGITFDYCRNMYVSEVVTPRIRKVAFNPTCALEKTSQLIQNQIAIYPNPASNSLHIDGVESASKYELFNIIGNIEQSGTLQKGRNELPISTLPTGMYLLQLTDEQGRKTMKKVVKE